MARTPNGRVRLKVPLVPRRRPARRLAVRCGLRGRAQGRLSPSLLTSNGWERREFGGLKSFKGSRVKTIINIKALGAGIFQGIGDTRIGQMKDH